MVDGTRNNRRLARCRVGATTLSLLLLCQYVGLVRGWKSSSSSYKQLDESSFGKMSSRDWLTNSKSWSIKVEGCVWGYVDDGEEAGCLGDSSEDGKESWYMMSNCRRANVVFSVHASDSSSTKCTDTTFKESFVSTNLEDFMYYVGLDSSSPFYGDDDDATVSSYMDCVQSNDGDGYYQSVGCNSDGTFTINNFNDQYCLDYKGVSSKLSNLNSKMNNYMKCEKDVSMSVPYALVSNSESCSSLDYSICKDDTMISNWMSGASKNKRSVQTTNSFVNKIKYATGVFLMGASFIMFMGILFTNRRRRRALMKRKFRNSQRKGEDGKSHRSRKSRSSKSGRSKSRTRTDADSSRRSKSARRSKSRSRRDEEEGAGGVLT